MTDLLLNILNNPSVSHAPTISDHQTLFSQPLRRFLCYIAWCWITYILLLAVFDHWSIAQRPRAEGLPAAYYLGQIGLALLVWGLSGYSRFELLLKSKFIPLIVLCLSVFPILLIALVLPTVPAGPISGTKGLLDVRMYPLLYVCLNLIAWHYPWKYVSSYSLCIFLLFVVLSLRSEQARTTHITTSILLFITMITFGYCISILITGLRRQQDQLLQINQQLSEANQQLQLYALTRERLTISCERNRMARELHDTLAHALSGIIVHLETIKAYWNVNPDAAYKLIDTALNNTRFGLNETRRALSALRSSLVDDLGLKLALHSLIETVATPALLHTNLQLPENFPLLSADLEHAIYRIVQEAITNVVDHAAAQTLTVTLTATQTQLMLSIHDDGNGFDATQPIEKGHFGLLGIYERAAFSGGTCQITSTGTGTTVYVILPFHAIKDHE